MRVRGCISFFVLVCKMPFLLTYLTLFHRCCVLITHGADLHPPLPLSVPLVEELLHNAVSPLTIQLQRLGGVAEIGTVHHVTQHLQTEMSTLLMSSL